MFPLSYVEDVFGDKLFESDPIPESNIINTNRNNENQSKRWSAEEKNVFFKAFVRILLIYLFPFSYKFVDIELG